MNGVTILSTTEVVAEHTYNWWLAGLIWLAIAIIGGVIGFVLSHDIKVVDAIIGFLIGALVGILPWLLVCLATDTPVAYENQYKVAISDDVSMNEFMEKYEIIEQEGKIYTVRERD